MTHLDRYLFRESVAPLLFALLLYSLLAIISATLPRLQWIVGTPLGELSLWLLLQLPAAVVLTLPIALVLTVLLVYGRLASRWELLAFQSGGISLLRLTLPLIILGSLATAASLWMNECVVPEANRLVGARYWELTAGRSGLWRLLKQEISLGDYAVYFERTDPKTDTLFDVRVSAWQDKRLSVIFAERAEFAEGGLKLYGFETTVLDLAPLAEAEDQPDAAAFLRRLLVADNRAKSPEQSLLITTSETVDTLVTRYSGGGFDDPRSISEAYRDFRDVDRDARAREQAGLLMHRKIAEPFANLTLLLVAVPLSLLYARNRGVAFGLSLVVTLVWYLLFTTGQVLAQAGSVPLWFGAWFGNLALTLLGIVLLIGRLARR